MNVDCVSDEKTGWGLAWLPLLIQIYIPTRNTFLPYILHHTTQMLLECHSKINIFTQKKKKKEINNLWGNHYLKSLRILFSPCQAIAHHCPQPALQAWAPQASAWLCTPQTVFVKARHYLRKCLEAHPTLKLGLQRFPVGTLLHISRTQR